MKSIHAYFEELATPGNTMGMGNPGETAPGELTEPIGKAFPEVEKDKKKKKKRKIKDLSESLFDKDITQQGVHIGDIYELDEWTIPARGKAYSFTDDIITWAVDYTKFHPNAPKWKNILKPLKSFPHIPSGTWMGNLFLKYMTELILCCESVKQIPSVVKDYIMECKVTPDKQKNIIDYDFLKQHEFKDVDVQVLDMPSRGMDLRMVVIKFIMENGDDYMVCVTFKKRDL